MLRKLALAMVLVAAVAAGCGAAPTAHSLDKTRECLEEEGARITQPTGDFVASTASEGTFRAHLPGGARANFVTLSFGADADEAATIADGYRRFRAKNIGVEDILYTDKNVAMLWKVHPTSGDEELVRSCLK